MLHRVKRARVLSDRESLIHQKTADFQKMPGEPETHTVRDAFLRSAGATPAAFARMLPRTDNATRTHVVSRLQKDRGNVFVQGLVETLAMPSNGVLQRQPEQASQATGAAKPEETISDEDKKEFDLLKGKIQDKDAAAYVAHRTKVFESPEVYQKFAAESDKELDETKGLRKRIEFVKEKDKQTLFYRWVRKAYKDAGVDDVPKLIAQGMSAEVKSALAEVRKAYGESFKAGGFNPRPMKDARYRYRLGTLSEHARGNAVDVEDKTNPILSLKDWAFIEKLAGKTVDRSASRWKDDMKAEALWKDIQELNRLFVESVASEIERVTKEQASARPPAAGVKPKGKKSAKPKKPPAPIDVVLKGHPGLKPWINGFFTLDWELVKQLRANGFLWGATFSNAVDLHHFELSKKELDKK